MRRPMSLHGRISAATFAAFWTLLDARQSPDLEIHSNGDLGQTREAIAGTASWDPARRFDMMGVANAHSIGSFFEVSPVQPAFFHRLPDAVATGNYPASFGIVGKLVPDPDGGTWVLLWYRLTNMRVLFYGLLVSLLCTAAAIGIGRVLISRWPAPDVVLSAIAVLVVAILPVAMIAAVAVNRRISNRGSVEELAQHLTAVCS